MAQTHKLPFGMVAAKQPNVKNKIPLELYKNLKSEKTHSKTLEYAFYAPDWSASFQQNSNSITNKRALRVQIMMQTVDAILRGKYYYWQVKAAENENPDQKPICLYGSSCYRKNPNHFQQYFHPKSEEFGEVKSGLIDKKACSEAAQKTLMYPNDFKYQPWSGNCVTSVMIVNGDCIQTALYLRNVKKLNPVVLNMASSNHPNGGYLKGAGAQEENLTRRTNLYQCLDDPAKIASARTWSYPIPEFGGIYTKDAIVLRESEARGYAWLPAPEKMSFVAVAAYKDPPLETQNSKLVLSHKIAQATKRKIETILNIALENKHDCVVLSALGCGAYGNPPEHVAELFAQVLNSSHKGAFKMVCFSIIDDHNSNKSHNPDGNVKPFERVFRTTAVSADDLDA